MTTTLLQIVSAPVPRDDLKAVLKEHRIVKAFEDMQRAILVTIPDAINQINIDDIEALKSVQYLVRVADPIVPNAVVAGSMAYVNDVPNDGNVYVREYGQWVPLTSSIAAGYADLPALEAIPARSFVNITDDAGIEVCRLADIGVGRASGFAPEGGAAGDTIRVYFDGEYSAPDVVSAGTLYLGTAGVPSYTPPIAPGEITQIIGYAKASGSIVFRPSVPIVLA